MNEALVVLVTTVDRRDAAERLARGLIERQLAACVQIGGPVASVYRWQGEIEDAREWTITVKTPRARLNALLDWLAREHPYETPELVWWPADAAAPYAGWARAVTEAADD